MSVDDQVQKSQYCYAAPTTGRILSPTTDKMWNLYRVNSTVDDEKGALIGKSQRRFDTTKVVAETAYHPEPQLVMRTPCFITVGPRLACCCGVF